MTNKLFWKCSACGYMNFDNHKECLKCKYKRENIFNDIFGNTDIFSRPLKSPF